MRSTGDILREQEHVLYGTGTSAWNGPNPVTLNTTHSGTTFTMREPDHHQPELPGCGQQHHLSAARTICGATATPPSARPAAVDALFGTQTEGPGC